MGHRVCSFHFAVRDGGVAALADVSDSSQQLNPQVYARRPPRLLLLFSVPSDRALFRPLHHLRQEVLQSPGSLLFPRFNRFKTHFLVLETILESE